MSYADFLGRKQRMWTGDAIPQEHDLPSLLFDWQAAVTRLLR